MSDFFQFENKNLTVETGYGEFCKEIDESVEGLDPQSVDVDVLITFLKFMRFKEKIGLGSKHLTPNKDD